MNYIVGVDPGQKKSGFVVCNGYKPLRSGIVQNPAMRELLINFNITDGLLADVVIEKPICRKWSGAEVSETAIWTGILIGSCPDWQSVVQITRQKVRMHTVGKKATDAKIRQYLIDRFDDQWLKDFKADIWQAYALVVTYLDEIGGKDV